MQQYKTYSNSSESRGSQYLYTLKFPASTSSTDYGSEYKLLWLGLFFFTKTTHDTHFNVLTWSAMLFFHVWNIQTKIIQKSLLESCLKDNTNYLEVIIVEAFTYKQWTERHFPFLLEFNWMIDNKRSIEDRYSSVRIQCWCNIYFSTLNQK